MSSIHTTPEFGCQGLAGGQFYPATIEHSYFRPPATIAMGSIGVTGLDKYLLGSVTDKVIRNSKVPVMVVR